MDAGAWEAYRRELFDLVGAEDPAEVQAAGPAAFRAIVASAGPALRTRPEPGEWSVLELVGHAEEVERARGRFRHVHDPALHEGPPIVHAYANRAAVLGVLHAQTRPEGQRRMRGGQLFRISTSSTSGAGTSIANGTQPVYSPDATTRPPVVPGARFVQTPTSAFDRLTVPRGAPGR